MSQDLFIEIFPIENPVTPLTAYGLQTKDGKEPNNGGRIAYRLGKSLSGQWVWAEGRLLTDYPVSPVQIDMTLDILRPQHPDMLNNIIGAKEDKKWSDTPHAQATFALHTRVRDAEDDLFRALGKLAVTIPNARVERECELNAWMIDNQPALSVSIKSHVVYAHSLRETMLQRQEKLKQYIGWRVMDKTAPTMVGTITAISGVMAQHRPRLLELTKRDVMRHLLQTAPDDEVVVKVQSGMNEYEYTASALNILIRPQEPDDWQRFTITPDHAYKAMRLRPDIRANLVKVVSDVLKHKGIVGNAYNSRTHKYLFGKLDFLPNLVYADKKVRVFNPKTSAEDFLKGKVYRKHPRFAKAPIKMAVINTLDDKIDDFVEALRRLLEREFGFGIELIKERKVKVLSAKNLESAVRTIEKEDPHIVLAFFQDGQSDEDDNNAQHLKTLTLAKGIATHIITEATMNNPSLMPLISMSILGKTGNTPFALAEPLEYADSIVGLNFVREQMSKGDCVTALARIYDSDGVFVRYVMETLDLERDETVPYILLQTLFPIDVFEKKRVIIHHDGEVNSEVRKLLKQWAKVLGAEFHIVEMLRRNVPRLYGLDKGVVQPAWGSIFLLNALEGFVVSSVPSADSTAQPLHIRVANNSIPIEQAVYSVLAWTLLHYGTYSTPKLPVTIQYADEMKAWLARGLLPKNKSGDVPFWL
jgi:hypothetical protein